MNKALLTAVLLVASVSVVSASGLNLAWGPDCFGDSQLSCLTWSCSSNSYASTKPGAVGANLIGMTISYALPYSKTNVVASDIYMEGIGTGSATPVPDWWKMNDGECRGNPNVVGVITLSGIYGGSFGAGGPDGGCFDYYQGTGGGGLGLYSDDAYRTHINGTWAVPDPLGEVPAEQETYAATYKIKTAKTYGAGSCGGCTTPWIWAVNYVQIAFQNEQTSLQLGTPIVNQCLGWNGGFYQGCVYCWGDAARPTTWGQMKSLYR